MARQSAGSGVGGKGEAVLFIVATPIGNLADMTQRAVETLRTADLVLAEDTRKTRVLLDHFGIKARMVSAHAHNEAKTIPLVLEDLGRGASVAIVTDAGTPLFRTPRCSPSRRSVWPIRWVMSPPRGQLTGIAS